MFLDKIPHRFVDFHHSPPFSIISFLHYVILSSSKGDLNEAVCKKPLAPKIVSIQINGGLALVAALSAAKELVSALRA